MNAYQVKRDFWQRLAQAAGVPRRLTAGGLTIPCGNNGLAWVTVVWYGPSRRSGDCLPRIAVSLAGPCTMPDLEVTCILAELPQWATWVAAWIKVRTGQADTIPAPPTRLDESLSAEELARAPYLWTRQAEHGYEFRRRLNTAAQDGETLRCLTGVDLESQPNTPTRGSAGRGEGVGVHGERSG